MAVLMASLKGLYIASFPQKRSHHIIRYAYRQIFLTTVTVPTSLTIRARLGPLTIRSFVLLTNEIAGHAADSLNCNQRLRPLSDRRDSDISADTGFRTWGAQSSLASPHRIPLLSSPTQRTAQRLLHRTPTQQE